MGGLVLGPLLRHVDETTACIWVETEDAGVVTVSAGEHRAEARTFAVHGHHYALVCVEGLAPGTQDPYTVSVDGEQVWPRAGLAVPAVADPDARPRQAAAAGVRLLPHLGHPRRGRQQARTAWTPCAPTRCGWPGVTDPAAEDDPDPGDEARWPDLVLFLGDQVYADETTAEMQEFIESRRDIDEPPGTELKDCEEYAHLYQLAWSDPANRWLLSTLPSAMIFDDHDIRDDWNTSHAWKQEMEATDWWHGRIVGRPRRRTGSTSTSAT